ncbi:MAG: hypothetical protein HY672_03175 [Chloroflexi bacterium]|nr:hypothetical protein [Chloroflexota bacterium]
MDNKRVFTLAGRAKKVPISSDGFTFAAYLDEAVRWLWPEAQADADAMLAAYEKALGKHVRALVWQARELNKGFRDNRISPVFWGAYERLNPVDGEAEREISRPYVAKWLLGHEMAHTAIGLDLLVGVMPKLASGTISPLLTGVIAEFAGVAPQVVKDMVLGRRYAQAILKPIIEEKAPEVGRFYLVQERALVISAVLLALRYIHPGERRHRKWIDVLDMAEERDLDVRDWDESNAIKSIRPYVKLFGL